MCNDVKEEMRELLLKKARGYDVEEKEVIFDKNKKETGKVKVTKKHIPPDVNAIMLVRNLIDNNKW